MYTTDATYPTEIDTGNGIIEAPATFSVYDNGPDLQPKLTLENLRLGGLNMPRADVLAWVGAAEVERLETEAAKEWKPYETDERSDQWAAQ